MQKNFVMKRIISLVLCAVLVASCLPAGLLTKASAAGEASGVIADSVKTDPSTLNAWKDTAFNPYDLTTEHAGGVWTDKTVLKPGDVAAAFPGVSGLNVASDRFLVALSALGANSVVVGKDSTPTDVIFVLDVSNSMENTDLSAMVAAVNSSVHTLLTSNSSNRVGVVVYGTNVNVLLPLDRYTPVTKGYGNNRTTAYIQMSDDYGSIQAAYTGSNWTGFTYITNSAGQNVTTSLSASGATYIQGGLWQAYQMFNNATVSDVRTPALVLMSDGAPTYGSTKFNNVGSSNVGNGTTNSVTDGLAFLTQLTAAYVKEKIADKYNTNAYFYSVGLGIDEGDNSVSIAESVLDSSRTRQTPENNWNTYLGLANQDNKTMTFRGTTRNVTITYDATVTASSKNYTNKYFSAKDASQLGEAFKSIVNEIGLKSSYNVTRVEGNDANTGGYVTFEDEIGTGMEARSVKGILVGNTLYTGQRMVQALLNQEFGTADAPTELGNNMVWALAQRMGIKDKVVNTPNGQVTVTATEQIHDLIRKAYTVGQISYNAQTGAFNNFICWFGDANGNYIDFWDYKDPDCVIPEGAVFANASYLMMGATTDDQTAQASDMMYIAVMISKQITQVNGAPAIEARATQKVTFRIPASLLPTITYQIEVEAGEDEEITEQTPAKLTYNAAEPIRLLYEVGVHRKLTPLNAKEFLRDGYPAKDADGNYYLYTNAWQWDGATADTWDDPSTHPDKGSEVLFDTNKNRITYAYFEPSERNEHYYYTEDTALYTLSGNSYVKLTTAPVTDGSVQYYFQHKTFTANAAQPGVEVTAAIDIHYGKVETKALAHTFRGDNGVYYIKEGTMHYGTIHDHDKLKNDNVTGSFKYRMHQLVEVTVGNNASDAHHYEITYLGNNGRVTYAPAQGLKLSKVMNDGSKPDVTFTFEVALTGQNIAQSYETVHVDANGNETEGTANVVSGKLTVTMKPGESIYILGLTAGTRYTVTETKLDGYRLQDKQSDTGVIAENAITEAVFTNAVQTYGALTVTKLVTYGDNVTPAADNNEFPVTVTLQDGAEDFTGTVQVNGTDYTVTDGKVTFTIKHSGRVVITGIPVGVTYSAAEGTLPYGYSWTNQGAATLSGTIDADGESAHLENAYDPDDLTLTNEAAIEVTKLYKHIADNTDTYQFDFELQRLIGGRWQKINESSVVYTNPDRGDHIKKAAMDLFGEQFTAAGEYFFRIAEIVPTQQLPGMTYDRTHHDFKVIVTDENLDGKLELKSIEAVDATVTAEKNAQTGVWEIEGQFTNTYETSSTKLTLAAKKVLTGATLKDGQFEFALYRTGEDFATTGESVTSRNGANGDVIFVTDVYGYASGISEYYYVMKELSTDGNGVTTDKAVWQIMVTVEGLDSGDAQIKSIRYHQQGVDGWTVISAPQDNVFDSITFENTYRAESAELALGGNKTLTNVTPGIAQSAMTVPANTYKFKLEAITAGAPMPESAEVFAAAGGAFRFGDITFTAADTYEYKITEINTNVAGVTYDATVYTVKVQVTDNGMGQLVAVATYRAGEEQEQSAVFHNTYKAEATAQLSIHAKKVLSVDTDKFSRTLKANDFRATLTHPNGTTETVFNDADGKFNFAPLSFDAVGTYTYSVTEIVPMGAVNGKLNGMIYDTVTKVFTIEVTDGGNGKLVAKLNGTTALSSASTEVAVITNSYEADPATVNLAAHKDLVDRDLVADEFTFKVEAITDRAPMPTATTVKNDANGDVRFGSISYAAVGVYKYKVTELVPNGAVNNVLDGVTYSQKVYTVTVEVVDLGNGKLHATVSALDEDNNTQPGGIVFTNRYKAEPVDAEIEASKKLYDLTGGANDELTVLANTFKFKLEALNGAPAPQTNEVFAAAGGAIGFGSIEFTEAGTYEYKLTEIDMQVPGVASDPTVYTVRIVIEDNKQGNLVVASITYNGSESAAVFTNRYTANAAEAEIVATKKLTNVTPNAPVANMAVPADTYKFKLEAVAGAPMPTGAEVYAAAGGAVSFGTIPYNRAGVYEYKLTEIDMNVAGVTTDTKVYTVVVTVKDDGRGQLYTESITYNGGSAATFENKYLAAPVEVPLAGEKIFTDLSSLPGNKKDLNDYEFRFTLAELGGTVIETVSDNGAGFAFTKLPYDAVGVHQYLIYEQLGGEKGIRYDYAKYRVTVTVTDTDLDGKLEASVKYEKASSGETDDYVTVNGVVFENTYTAKKTAVTFAGTKVLEGGRKLKAGDFSFTLCDANGEIETVKNDANGDFTFTEIEYLTEGNFVYTLKEVNEGAANIAYDGTEYTITVTVADVNGELQATTVVTTAEGVVTEYGFTNIYTPENADFSITVQKVLKNESDKAMGLDGFRFKLELDGESETLTTGADGKVKFDLSFGADDIGNIYTFKLSEVKGDVEGMTYDETVYEIVIAVTQNDEGEIVLGVTREGTGDFTFENTYAPEEDEVPKTGVTMDGSWTLMMAVSAICGLAVLVLGKKKLLAE